MLLILGHTHTLTHTLHDSLPPHTTAPFCKASVQIRVCICPPSLAANSTVTKLISSIWFWHVFSLACVVFHVVCEKCAFDFFSLMTMLTNYCHWDSEEFLWDHSRVYLHPLYKFFADVWCFLILVSLIYHDMRVKYILNTTKCREFNRIRL